MDLARGLIRLIKRVASIFFSIVFIAMHVYTSDLFIANCCSTSIEQSRLKFSECLKIAHARTNFVEVLDCSSSAYQTFLKALAAHVL